MLHFECLTIEDLRSEAQRLKEESTGDITLVSTAEAVNLYLNSKPGTWKLISHCMGSPIDSRARFQFIWSTGDER